jgi:hypothetical protein
MHDTFHKTVFISYAHEDESSAEKLSKDLKKAGLFPWRDKESIRAGEDWKLAISKAIKNSRYFIPLFSSKSVDKIGHVQKEFKYALDIFENYPPADIFIIPVRIDECEIPYPKLESIDYADLFPHWNKGIERILKSIGIETKEEKTIQENKEQEKRGLSDIDWEKLLTHIYNKKCIPFIGTGANKLQSKDGKSLIPLNKDIIDKWKEKHHSTLKELYDLARIHALEDSYQLARLAEFLEIEKANEYDEMYPKTMLSEMLKEIDLFKIHPQSKLLYDILANLNLPIYITTNYDHFLEKALSMNTSKEPKSEVCKWNDGLAKYMRNKKKSMFDETYYKPDVKFPLVYHIYGDIDTPESMVLTERDYFEFVINLNKSDEKDTIPPIIRQELNESVLLFIGYTLEDINFRAIFQGFLSFMSSIDRKYRKPSIAVQIPPIISKENQAKMQKYLEQYTRHMFDVRIFWGETIEFITELERKWNEFKKNQ